MIHFQKAAFYQSVSHYSQLPLDQGLEVAFAGCSNVGKSTLINTLTQQKKLAYTSKTPGRTQLINFFTLDNERRLVDLPGYGYAKAPRKQQRQWQKLVNDYLQNRESLVAIILLIDSRHIDKPSDRQMIDWASHYHIPLHIILTKTDKLSRQASIKAKNLLAQVTSNYQLPISLQLFSAMNKQGLIELKEQIGKFLKAD